MTKMKQAHKLPDFFCLGVAKAGTTTLHYALLHHPQIFLPERKETFFFSADYEYRRGIDWYLDRYFSSAETNILRGEIAATYLYHGEKVAQRFIDSYGNRPPKLIILFRNPVDRAYSQYWHMRRLGLETLSFREALELEDERRKKEFIKNAKNGKDRFAYFENGLYVNKMQPFLNKFERQQFLFLLFDDLIEAYDVVMNEVLAFLDVSLQDLPRERRNEARMAENSQTMLWNRSSSDLKTFIRKIIPDDFRQPMGKVLGLHKTHPFKYPSMEKDLELKLREMYKEEIVNLAGIINKDLSRWLD